MVCDFAALSPGELEAICLDWAKRTSLPMSEQPKAAKGYKIQRLVNSAVATEVMSGARNFIEQGGDESADLAWFKFLGEQISRTIAEAREGAASAVSSNCNAQGACAPCQLPVGQK